MSRAFREIKVRTYQKVDYFGQQKKEAQEGVIPLALGSCRPCQDDDPVEEPALQRDVKAQLLDDQDDGNIDGAPDEGVRRRGDGAVLQQLLPFSVSQFRPLAVFSLWPVGFGTRS